MNGNQSMREEMQEGMDGWAVVDGRWPMVEWKVALWAKVCFIILFACALHRV